MCDIIGGEMCRIPLAANLPEERQTHTHVISSVSFWVPWISIVQLGVVFIVFIAFEY